MLTQYSQITCPQPTQSPPHAPPGDYRTEKPSPTHVHPPSDWPNHTSSLHAFPNLTLARALARYGSENRGSGADSWIEDGGVCGSCLSCPPFFLTHVEKRSTHTHKNGHKPCPKPEGCTRDFFRFSYQLIAFSSPGHVFFVFGLFPTIVTFFPFTPCRS